MPGMSVSRRWAAIAAVVAAVAAGGMGTAARAAASGRPVLGSGVAAVRQLARPVMPPIGRHPVRRACPSPSRPGAAMCLALVRTDVKGRKGLFAAGAAPSGYGPADLQSAYGLPSATAGSGATVAIIDAYDDPNAEADLATYRAQYGLPPCTTANGCFTKVNQQGQQGNYPSPNSNWAAEISLDLDMVSAICPNCKILLVEASSNNGTDLGPAVSEAVALGAQYVSNSYGTSGEDPSETNYDQYYNHPGVAVTASAGDSGYGVNYPAASPYVTSVGGTSLVKDTSTPRGWAESAWGSASGGQGTGSGCSAYEAKPGWQADAGCANRTVADVSAVADPSTGVAVYDSYQQSGWAVYGGTSVSAPVIASAYALAGQPGAGSYPARYLYAHHNGDPSLFNDVTSGADGSCTPAYLCTAGPGYDGPTGLGTPHGVTGLSFAQLGSVTGTVTDTSTGKPIAGAQVSAPGLAATTGTGGSYTLAGLPAGSYQLTASGYGYQNQTQTVTVTAGQAASQNFQLTGLPHATVSGTVTAAAGTHWPLYARVSWSDGNGHSGTASTTPATGGYTLSLLQDSSYTLTVTPLYPGYRPATRQVTVAASGVTQNLTLGADTLACTALGYHPVLSGRTQTFSTTSTPKGWTVTNTNLHYPGYAYTPGWVFTNPGHRANSTGGTGNFAIVDSSHYGQSHYQDTRLTSPAMNFSADKHPVVQFATSLAGAVNSTATVQASADNGRTWATVWTSAGAAGDPGPATVVVPLPRAAGKTAVKVRFGYTGQWSGYWEIGNVFLGNRTCVPQPGGGLLTGRVSDPAGAAINGATIASLTHPGQHAVTVATPGDTGVNGGLYALFTTATGSQRFTATAPGYTPATQTAAITAGQASTLNFTMAPG